MKKKGARWRKREINHTGKYKRIEENKTKRKNDNNNKKSGKGGGEDNRRQKDTRKNGQNCDMNIYKTEQEGGENE